jgi:hypothetical protein
MSNSDRDDVLSDPSNWKSADEPMTAGQARYLQDLCKQRAEPFNPKLTKAQAAGAISRLKREGLEDPKPRIKEPKMTDAQANYLKKLCAKTGRKFDPTLTKAQAAATIEYIKTGKTVDFKERDDDPSDEGDVKSYIDSIRENGFLRLNDEDD